MPYRLEEDYVRKVIKKHMIKLYFNLITEEPELYIIHRDAVLLIIMTYSNLSWPRVSYLRMTLKKLLLMKR